MLKLSCYFSRNEMSLVVNLYLSPLNGGGGLCLQAKVWYVISSFHSSKGVLFDSFIASTPFSSVMEIMGAVLWVGISSLAQKRLRTKIRVCAVDSVEKDIQSGKGGAMPFFFRSKLIPSSYLLL